MAEKKTISISTDPVFLEELSEYLEALANPLRLKILKFIEREPKEITAIAEHIGMSYQNTKKHLDRLVSTSIVQRTAGFGRETERGIAPVWKYSLADGGLENLTATLGVFSSIATPLGYNDIRERIEAVRSHLQKSGGPAGPVLYLIGGPADGRAFILTHSRIPMGREDPDNPPAGSEGMVVLPDEYRAVTRVTRPHAFLVRTVYSWQIEDNASTGGTFLNSRRLDPLKSTPLSSGDVIDLSIGAHAARFLFIADE
ncbi:MAG: FHA domain-containing protein [Methanoregula sp.]|nr:FHA domain-containing protein [Methanoregula sp.]